MKIRDAQREALKRAGTPDKSIDLCMYFIENLLPHSSFVSHAEIKIGQEEAFIQRLVKAIKRKSYKARQKDFEFCESKLVNPSNN